MDPPDELGAISSHAWDIFRLGLKSFDQKFEAHIWNEVLVEIARMPTQKS